MEVSRSSEGRLSVTGDQKARNQIRLIMSSSESSHRRLVRRLQQQLRELCRLNLILFATKCAREPAGLLMTEAGLLLLTQSFAQLRERWARGELVVMDGGMTTEVELRLLRANATGAIDKVRPTNRICYA